jgi:hypothetical protein
MKPVKLTRYDAMCSAIAVARRVDEIKNIRDKAVALAAYAKQAKNHDAERWAQEIRIRAERKTGQLLRETAKAKGGKPPQAGNRSKPTTGFAPATLAELGISKDQSADWQKLAKVPNEEFEAALTDKDGMPSGRRIVKIGLYNLKVRQDEKLRKRGEPVPSPPSAVRHLAKSLDQEMKWSVEEACFFGFIKSKIGKELIAKVSEVVPPPLSGSGMLPCEKVNTMHDVLVEWFNINWTKLPLPNVDELVKSFEKERVRRNELQATCVKKP